MLKPPSDDDDDSTSDVSEEEEQEDDGEYDDESEYEEDEYGNAVGAGGDEFEGGRVRDGEVAGCQRGAQPLGHGLGLIDGRHGPLPGPASVRRCPRCRPSAG